MIDLDLLFCYLKGRCHGNQFWAKLWQNYLPPALIIALSSRNGMGYRLADARINNSTIIALHHVKMVKIGSVVFESKWGRK